MDLRDILLILHIVAAGAWLGANVIQAVVPPLAIAQGPEVAAGWHQITARLMGRLYIPASVLILITGIWLVTLSSVYTFGSLFVTIGFGMIIVGAILGRLVFEPGGRRAAEALESGIDTGYREITARLARFGVADTLLLVFTIGAMVVRWM